MSETVADTAMRRKQIILTSAWWFGSVCLIVFAIFLGSRDNLFPYRTAPLDWLLPHVAPMMGLTGVTALLAKPKIPENATAGILNYVFGFTLVVSALYIVFLGYCLVEITMPENGTVMDEINSRNSSLGVLQGLVATAIGAFYVKRQTGLGFAAHSLYSRANARLRGHSGTCCYPTPSVSC